MNFHQSISRLPARSCLTGRNARSLRGSTLGKLLAVALALAPASGALAQQQYHLPLFMSASDPTRQGFARIVNRSDRAGTVTIHAIDDQGNEAGPVTLSLAAKQTRHFNSGDLERGAPDKGLTGRIGSGQGNWRLKLETNLDIEPLAYIRTPADGFLTSIHDVVQGKSLRWNVPIFNPGSNTNQRSLLRLINTSGIDTEVTIAGLDDQGMSGQDDLKFSLSADEARLYSARDLEDGHSDFEGSLGDGSGKWQLLVSADRPIQVMSLMRTPTGHMTSLSSTTGDPTIRGGPGGDELFGGNGDDVIDPGDNGSTPGELDIVHGSAGDDRIVYTGSGTSGLQSLQYSTLNAGITVTIEGAANRATVDKGSAGTDTIVDIANPLNASGSPPYNGSFELRGTPFGDTFDLALAGGQWMDITGNAGADTFNIESGLVRIDYDTSPAGVDVDLAAGRADDDGFGDSDTFNGRVWGVAGSEFSDVLRGTNGNDVLVGRAGNDRIDGRGGFDRLQFGTDNPRYARFYDIGDIDLDLAAGTATGTWNGKAFSYTLSSIERVRGGPGNDTLRGTDGGDRLNGGNGNDVIDPRSNDWRTGTDDKIDGSAGSDRIVYTGSTGRYAYQGLSYMWVYDAYHDTRGITVTIDGGANRATVDKGADGTDTIVDIANPLSGGGGFGIEGTSGNDVFNINLAEGQWMQASGGPGNDRFNIQGEPFRISYTWPSSRNGIDVDLAAGRANDDGFGNVDTFNGTVGEIRGTDLTDTIRGSDNHESFIGRRGNDVIDGRGGWDQLRFDRTGVGNIVVDLRAGTATGTWGDSAFTLTTPWFLEPIVEQVVGSTFSYRISNIERVRGGSGDDRLYGSNGNDRLEGRDGDDVLQGREGNDDLAGDGGADTFVFEPGHGEDRIRDFADGEDLILFRGLDIRSKEDVLANAHAWDDGTGVWIDLRPFGGGTLSVGGISRANFDEDDFAF